MSAKNPPDNRQNLPENPFESPSAGRMPGPRISMIATPIGNLRDLTMRAREALEGVDELWCEDTRHTQKLLSALGVAGKRLRRLDQHVREEELRAMLKEVSLRRQWVGVVTDAGTPGLSDPGALIGQLAEEFPEIRLEPVPGPSALSALVSIGGLPGSSFYFHGFFPREEREARDLLERLLKSGATRSLIFFESPHRIRAAIRLLGDWCGETGASPGFVFAKELTKLHEQVFRGEGAGFLKTVQDRIVDERGEWAFVIILPKVSVKNELPEAEWGTTLQCLLDAGISAGIAARILSERYPVAKNLAYKRALELQKKAENH